MSPDNPLSSPIRRPIQMIDRNYQRIYRKILRPIDRKVSRATTKTPVRLSHHIVGKYAVKRAQQKSNHEPTGPRNLEFENDKDDYLTLGQHYDHSLIQSIRDTFEDLLNDNEYTYTQSYDGEVYGMGMRSPSMDFTEYFPDMSAILNDRVRSLVQDYYGAHFKPMRIAIYRNHHVPPQIRQESEIYSNFWHCDDRTIDHFKLFVTLSEVTDDDGPFHVLSKENTARMISRGYNRNKDGVKNEIVEEHADVKKFTGPKGSAALCNTELQLHRAGTPEEGHKRDMIMISFVPSDSPLPDDWFKYPEMYSHQCENGVRRLFSY